MKVLVFGANGFLGSEVVRELKHANYDVADAVDQSGERVDLLNRNSIESCIALARPHVIVNCAGVVDNIPDAAKNVDFSLNILAAILTAKVNVKKVIITGSAAEYGEVEDAKVPIKEDAHLRAESLYGKSKVQEVQKAIAFGQDHDFTVVAARVFNPIGVGMKPKFLISRLIDQLNEVNAGTRQAIEVSRLDALRDYVDVEDVARGVVALVTGTPNKSVYNIGSGRATSNKELIDTLIEVSGIEASPEVIETSEQPEPQYAARADISSMKEEFGWMPKVALKETLKEIIAHAK